LHAVRIPSSVLRSTRAPLRLSPVAILWNSDAGTSVTSHALSSALTAMVDARNSRSHVLVGASFAGTIAMWSLTLFGINPAALPLEKTLHSRHARDDPGILSLAFHEATNTFFSGGNDSNIVAWRLDSEA
jgi:hypothetical protein